MNSIDAFNLPLFPVNLEIVKKIVHQWNVNDCVVYLIQTQDILGHPVLEYKTIKNKKEIYVDRVGIPESESVEETISFIKTCKAAVDENGVANFFENHRNWVSANREFSSQEDKLLAAFFNLYKRRVDETGNADLFKKPLQWLKAIRTNAELDLDLELELSDLEMEALSLLAIFERLDMLKHVENVFSIENIFMNAFSSYRAWSYDPNVEINLISGSEGLLWNIFQRTTKESSFYHFQEITRPSLRCHPQTVALIEKIKTEAFSNPELLCCLMRDFNVRVINSEILEKELSAEVEKTKKDHADYYRNAHISMAMRIIKPVAATSIYLLRNAVMSAARTAKGFFSGGILGAITGGCTGIAAGATALGVGSIVALQVSRQISPYFYATPDSLCKKQVILKEKIPLSLQSPVFIEVEPISAPSTIDKKVCVSKFTWAVTLVTHTGCFGNHAQIIIEGINDGFFDQNSARIKAAKEIEIGEKFIHLADFSPKIEYGLLSPDDLKYETRTETWMRSSDQVKKMLEAIEETKYRPKDKLHPFNFFGIHSKFYKFNLYKFNFSGKIGDNCFTFLREKLKMIDIDIGESYVDLIAAMVKNYTRNKKEYEMLPIQELI